MTEPTTPTPVPQETLGYQPISGWAIAGFAIGLLFCALVAISAIVALFQGTPLFFPLWVMAIAIGGVIVSLIGQQHVQQSEGTRAGAKLARAGLWLSLLSGLIYFSYYYFTGLALQGQAHDFLMDKGDEAGFFPLLREGARDPVQFNRAFLLTRPATSRSGRPDNELEMLFNYNLPSKEGQPGAVLQFKEHILARLFFGDMAKEVEITPLVVQDWRYEKGSYKIVRPYRLATKEGEVEVIMTVQSTEAEVAGEGRKWFLNLSETYPLNTIKLTPFGQGLRLLRWRAQKKLEEWLHARNNGQPNTDFADKDQTRWDLVLPSGKKGDSDNREEREALHLAVAKALAGKGKNHLLGAAVTARDEDMGKWEQVDGKIRIHHVFRFAIAGEASDLPLATIFASATLETRQAMDPGQFEPRSPAPEWEIRRLAVLQIVRMERKGPRGP